MPPAVLANDDRTPSAGRQESRGRLPGYIPELDGIRAIAIWMVLLVHVFVPDDESGRALSRLPKAVLLVLGHGWLGVDLFFVLSGFLITGILLQSREQPHYIRNFYGRRVLRIMPLYFTCIAVMAFFYPGNSAFFLLSLVFMANMVNLFGVQSPHGPGVFWSLAVEEHFYLVWPWLVRILSRRALALVCGVIVVGEPVLRAIYVARGVDVYPLSWFRFDGLASGALLALWFRSPFASKRRSLTLAAACVAASLIITVAGLPFGILSKTVAGMSLRYTQATLVFSAAMLAAVAARSTSLTAPLRTGFARLTGDLSYCLYLIHLSIWDGYMAIFRHFVPQGLTFWDVMLRALVVIPVCYGLALLSRRFLERPFLAMKRYLHDGPVRRSAPRTEGVPAA